MHVYYSVLNKCQQARPEHYSCCCSVLLCYFEQKLFVSGFIRLYLFYEPFISMCLMQAVNVNRRVNRLYYIVCVCVCVCFFVCSFPQEFIATTLIRLLNVTPPHHTRMPRATPSFPSPSTHTGYLSTLYIYISVCLSLSQCLSILSIRLSVCLYLSLFCPVRLSLLKIF